VAVTLDSKLAGVDEVKRFRAVSQTMTYTTIFSGYSLKIHKISKIQEYGRGLTLSAGLVEGLKPRSLLIMSRSCGICVSLLSLATVSILKTACDSNQMACPFDDLSNAAVVWANHIYPVLNFSPSFAFRDWLCRDDPLLYIPLAVPLERYTNFTRSPLQLLVTHFDYLRACHCLNT
jgi:hypothetical protein